MKKSDIRYRGPAQWTVAPGTHVAITWAGLYYAGRGVISKILCRDPFLVEVKVIDVCYALDQMICFPVGDMRTTAQCAGRDVIWEAEYLRPYGVLSEEHSDVLGGPPTPVPVDNRPVPKSLTLARGMVVALLDGGAPSTRCVGIGVIEECSPKGVWHDFVVPHNFFVIVRLQIANWEFRMHVAHCESPDVQTLECAVNRKILWSGYKVRPLEGDPETALSSQGSTESRRQELGSTRSSQNVRTAAAVGGPPSLNSTAAPPRRTVESDTIGGGIEGCRGTTTSHGNGSTPAPSGERSDVAAEYPRRPLWRGRHCELLNEDLSVFGRARIQVCMPEEPCDEDPLGDHDVGVIFLSEGGDHLQMTTFRWPLVRVRLEGGRYLSDIVQWLSDNSISDAEDGGLDGFPKNAYRHMKRKRMQRQSESKLNRKTSRCDIQIVSAQRCCKYRCCQTFRWEDTMTLRRMFYSSPFESRREIAYAVQGQLHSVPGRTKKYITMAGRDVCENAWYIIHGVSRAAYHNYKAAARGGFCNGSHGNTGMSRPRPRTIQAEANVMTIINASADRMPNEFRCIGGSRVNNVLVLPCTLNWDQVRLLSNSVFLLPPTPTECFRNVHAASRIISVKVFLMYVDRGPVMLDPKSAARGLQEGSSPLGLL